MRCISPINLRDPRKLRASQRLVVPCGKCGACKARHRAQWSFRLAEELKDYGGTGIFLTVTYNDENLPPVKGSHLKTLKKSDYKKLTRKIKWLNKKVTKRKIRYYGVGEYGSKTFRPHYHLLIFGLHEATIGTLRNDHLITDDKDKAWGKGFLYVGEITGASIHYVTKYHVQKNNEWIKDYLEGVEPEFTTMSNGIGKGYITNGKGKFNQENEALYVNNNGFKQSLPRYYRDKLFEQHELDIINIRHSTDNDKKLAKEIKRLEKMGYEEATLEIEIREFIKAQKLGKAKHEKDTM